MQKTPLPTEGVVKVHYVGWCRGTKPIMTLFVGLRKLSANLQWAFATPTLGVRELILDAN